MINNLRVLYLDLFPEKAHKSLNKCLILAIKDKFFLDIITEKKYFSFDDFILESIKEYGHFPLNYLANFMVRLRSIYIILFSFRIILRNSFDRIFIPTFETITFSFFYLLHSQIKEIYILHHLNTDELKSPVKKFFFKFYMNKVNHIVFEQFIKDYLVNDIGVRKELVHTIPHPLRTLTNDSVQINHGESLCVGISNSNQDILIQEIINYEEKSKSLQNNNVILILKSTNIEYSNTHLIVFKGFLSREHYEGYLNRCSMILMLHSPNHSYRASGFLFDGLSNRKIAIGNNIKIMQQYSENFPAICKIGNSAAEILDLITNFKRKYDSEKEFDLFLEQYSSAALANSLNKILS